MDSNSLLTSLMQLAERSKRSLRAAPGQIADQVSNFIPDWKAVSADAAIKRTTGDKTDEEVFKKAAEEIAMNSLMPGGAKLATVFHGTGTVFEPTLKNKLGEFARKFIGSGEGNAAFGHGAAYTAERKEVAEHYFNTLSKPLRDKTRIDAYVNAADDLHPTQGRALGSRLSATGTIGSIKTNNFVVANMLDNLRSAGKESNIFTSWSQQERNKAIDLLETIKKEPMVVPSGSLYKVALNDEAILKSADWKLPIKDQPKHVIDVLSAITGKNEYLIEDTFGQYYNKLAMEKGQMYSPARSTPSMKLAVGKQKLSDQLEYMGIRGINYLDALSRTPGKKPTYNHVVFDPADLTILEKLR